MNQNGPKMAKNDQKWPKNTKNDPNNPNWAKNGLKIAKKWQK